MARGVVTMTTESSTYRCARLPTNHADTKSDPNLTPNLNPTAKQHAIVSIQLIIVARLTHTGKFIRDNVVAPFVLHSVVMVSLPLKNQY